jgi:hypothetical protein
MLRADVTAAGEVEIDPRYEFDAPKVHYDLSKSETINTSADRWFGMSRHTSSEIKLQDIP